MIRDDGRHPEDIDCQSSDESQRIAIDLRDLGSEQAWGNQASLAPYLPNSSMNISLIVLWNGGENLDIADLPTSERLGIPRGLS